MPIHEILGDLLHSLVAAVLDEELLRNEHLVDLKLAYALLSLQIIELLRLVFDGELIVALYIARGLNLDHRGLCLRQFGREVAQAVLDGCLARFIGGLLRVLDC